MMNETERQLMRLLHGELSPEAARRLERQLERDGELRAARDRLARTWDGLELPPAAVPADFSAGVMAAARGLRKNELRDGDLSWSLAPAWARTGAAVALVCGLLLGTAFGSGFQGALGIGAPGVEMADTGDGEALLVADADADAVPLSLAEIYWLSVEEGGDLLAEAADSEVVR